MNQKQDEKLAETSIMYIFNSQLQSLMHQLEKMGMDNASIPGFIWSMKSCVLNHPDIDYDQLNRKIQAMGWHDLQLNCSTFQLILDCFSFDGV